MGNEKVKRFTNKEIVTLLRSVAASYTLSNENRFRIIAYQNASGAVEHMTRELHDMWEEGNMKGIPGLGSTILSHLDELFKTGRSKHFNEVIGKYPASLYKLMTVPSIGVKTSYKLVKEFNFKNPDTIFEDIKKAAREGKIRSLPTFGEKSEQEILRAIELHESNKNQGERMPLPYAYIAAQKIMAYVKKLPYVGQIDALGSMRRMVATIGDIDIAVIAKSEKAPDVVKHFINYPGKIAFDNAGEKKASIIVSPNIRVDLRVQEKESYGSMLQYFTGSKNHNIKLREYALKKGMSLSEYGIKHKGKLLIFDNEKDFYGKLGLEYIPPEIREGTDEISYAIQKKVPKLVEVSDIKGDLHLHSSYDLKPSHDFGRNTYKEIAQYGKKKGYDYVGFADHNPKQAGLTKEEVVEIMRKRKYYIDKLFSGKKSDQSDYFIGLETDILPDGSIALPKEAVDYVDYLIVSVHSSFGMSLADMTKRIIKALVHPKVKIFGHPTARLLSKRPSIDVNWREVFKECVSRNIALEINSWPDRLDLPDSLVREAKDMGAKFVIDTDAHANPQMDNMLYGVSVARRGWCTEHDILNTMPYNEFRKWLVNK